MCILKVDKLGHKKNDKNKVKCSKQIKCFLRCEFAENNGVLLTSIANITFLIGISNH